MSGSDDSADKSAARAAPICTEGRAPRRVPPAWFRSAPDPREPNRLRDMTITAAFLHQARRQPDKVAVADHLSGALTYRDMVLAVMLLKRQLARLEGAYLGIMLPASVAVSLVYLAALFAGKIPVMVNWTLGRRNLQHALDSLSIRCIISAQALLSRIGARGIDLSDLTDRFVLLEDVRSQISKREKLGAFVKAHVRWSELSQATGPETAAVLFTSGSESVPKAVPLTHRNILANVSDAYECFTLSRADSFLGMLPPFHSFGLTASLILPLTLGSRVVFYPDPTHGGTLGQIVDTYKSTLLLGAPTFLNGILRASRPQQLRSVRLVVSGAEKCPERLYDLLADMCPQAKVLEGYGVTECAPIISVNHESNPRRGTIGKVMSSLDYAIVDLESGLRVLPGREGMLVVRGDSVFGGYLHYDGPSPFVECEGKLWYRTGDLVVEDSDGTLTFRGRVKRFIKLGGEMVSLPAIESVLEQQIAHPDDNGPVLAVVATPTERKPDVVLFCTREITRKSANKIICQAGLSGLHSVRQIRRIESLPLLGTGKVDHKSLTARLVSELDTA
jgi:acyl-[acyl-carrier-protein]-phospholipid O-acyltransferase/long-chain-fatty-acid--[acyl-carrier-protein] ligase